MKGFRLRNIVGIFLIVLLGASVLMAHVWKQNSFVRISKEAVRLGRDYKVLRDSIAVLEMATGSLRNLGRIEALAKTRFGLEYGNTPVMVYPEAAGGGPEGVMARAERSAWPTNGL